MIRLITNTPQYFNDIAEEIRLFLGMAEIGGAEVEGADTELRIELLADRAEGSLLPGGLKCSVPFTYDDGDAMDKKRQQKRAVKLIAYRLMKERFVANTPWGALTGIRPTKLLRELSQKYGETEALRQFSEVFSVSGEKSGLARTICAVQKPFIESAGERALDVYIGIPYCRSRCLYCSFGSAVARTAHELSDYLAYLKRDIHEGAKLMKQGGYELRSIYVGGGTPTVFSADQLSELLTCALNSYGGFGEELTVEAGRPDTITAEKLRAMRELGVSRVSVNPQTMQDRTLGVVGRTHTSQETADCFQLVRSFGFYSINMDVIAGLPGEGTAEFEDTMNRIAELRPDNLTVHTLAIKRSSRLKETLPDYALPEAEVVESMTKLGAETAKALSMRPYYMYRQKYMQGNLENVGYAVAGKECLYNIDMMEETASIMAHGAGAMSKRVFGAQNRVERLRNPKDIQTYFEKQERLFEQKKELFLSD
ncbi:MAG: coproporphyrinogen dehydrogenase HemZ [Clostridia bacterium]|nr:coproporphyrinogen dehydrogenase HemZ [Clostridia bacterium]